MKWISAAIAASVVIGASSAHAAIIDVIWTGDNNSTVSFSYDDALAPYFTSTDGMGNPYRANFEPGTTVTVKDDAGTFTFTDLFISALQNIGSIHYDFSAGTSGNAFAATYNTTAAANLNTLPSGFPIGAASFGTTYSVSNAAQRVSETVALTGNGKAGAVPEPSSWALMILGFGSLGAVARWRRELSLA